MSPTVAGFGSCVFSVPPSSGWLLHVFPKPVGHSMLLYTVSSGHAPPNLIAFPRPLPLPRSGAGGSGCARRGTRRVDTLSGSGACCVPQRRGARSAREQRAVGTHPRCGLRLPAPPAGPALLVAGRWAGGCSWEHSGPGTGAQCCTWKPRAALERRLDSAPAEAAEERAAGALRDRLNFQAGRGLGGLGSLITGRAAFIGALACWKCHVHRHLISPYPHPRLKPI